MNSGLEIQQEESKLISVMQGSLYPGAKAESVWMVINYCQAAKIDPMLKPVHIVPIWDAKAGQMRDVVMPGIGLYRILAARSGEYGGISDAEYGPEISENIGGHQISYPEWCRITVFRIVSGQRVGFSATERWKENYAVKGGKERSIAPNAMWSRRPFAQLAKCAEAQALRKAFPEVGSAATAEEMEGRQDDESVVSTQVAQPVNDGPEPYSEADFNNSFPKWEQIIKGGKKTPKAMIEYLSGKGVNLSTEQETKIKNIEVSE